MDPAILAYTAGIIDGEGTISCIRRVRGEGSPWYNFQLRVHMKYNKIPYFLQSVWGGSVYQYKSNQAWVWHVQTKRSREILKQIYPYLIEKPDQAKLVFEFENIQKNKQSFRLTDSEKDRYSQIHDELKALHG